VDSSFYIFDIVHLSHFVAQVVGTLFTRL